MTQTTTRTKKQFKADCTCPGCSLWLRLEAERLDPSWRVGRSKNEPTIIYQDRIVREIVEVVVEKVVVKEVEKEVFLGVAPKAQEARDRLYFNAGRYAGGARDASAAAAFEQLAEEESE